MSFPKEEIPFCPREHRKRVENALRRRLYPNTNLHAKQLAGIIGCTARTVQNWADGKTGLSSEGFGKLYAYFGASFHAEIYGEVAEGIRQRFEQRKRETLDRLAREEQILNTLTGGQAP